MQLSSTLFAEIIGVALNAPAGSAESLAEQDERRRSPRVTVALRARVYPLMESAADQGQTVLVRDLSRHGVGMLIAEPMSLGDEFVLHLPAAKPEDIDQATDPVVQIHCSVRRCEAGGSGQTQFQVGATFELVLNRPLLESVQMPDESTQSDESAAFAWTEPPPSPFEQKFDEQLAEAVQSLPPRQSVSEHLADYWLARLIIRLLLLPVRWFSEPIRRRLIARGWLEDADSDTSKIRSRLTAKRRKQRRRLSDLSDTVEHLDPDEPATVTATEPPLSFAERSLADALDSASQLINADPENLPIPSPASAPVGLERRHSLFAAQPIETLRATPVAASEVQPAVELVASGEAPIIPPMSPVAVPSFELPAVLPTTLSPTEPAIAEAKVAAIAVEVNPLQFVLDSIDPTMDVPREPHGKSRGGKVAWRSRHRVQSDAHGTSRKKSGR